ncbi:PRC-barrel domain-containing protein [Aminobacter aganoensis]|uniref:Sporulation protein YlmC with PRC-barrel domain n=1 Tax=Aminobacter aganoensis TaxID=83264 RepID=A0A7X0FCC4_9HYPH|nr:PRC-barrel domain-containing protein [Aminobacter aganoensis]MBB6357126.1 sporulation protein YlmC with PRC-barrel domain [Aminobacter aganoensis]
MHDVIDSSNVIGTKVYDLTGVRIGSVESLVLTRTGGRVVHVVLIFGGFLGLADEHYPVPWAKLSYDEKVAGFKLDITKEQLEKAPRYISASEFDWSERNTRQIYGYYGAQPDW